MRRINSLPLIALLCVAACSSSNEDGPASRGDSKAFATQTEAPAPDYEELLDKPPLGSGAWITRESTAEPPPNAKEIGQIWYDRLADRNVLLGAGYGGKGPDDPVMLLDTGLTEAEFDGWISDNGWDGPGFIRWTFVPELNLPPFTEAARKGIRVWPASTARTGAQNEALLAGRVELRDGCFYGAEGSGDPEKLAFFHGEIGLDVDDEGYYVLRDRVSGLVRARLGEPMHWGGPPSAYIDPELEREIQAQCGPAEILVVGSPESRERLYTQLPHLREPAINPPPPDA